MAITVVQSGVNRNGIRLSGKAATLDFIVKGTTDKVAAYGALITSINVPTIINGLYRVDADCEVEEITDKLGGIWRGTASYAINQPTQNTFSVTFDFSVQNTKVFQSKKTIGKYKAGGRSLRDFRGAIGVNEDGTIEGVDIGIPQVGYNYGYRIANSTITTTWMANLYKTVGKMNRDTWKGFRPGEVLLTKVVGQRVDNLWWDVSYCVTASENKTNFVINPSDPLNSITVATKKGWDYLWVYYQTEEVTSVSDATVKFTHKVPVQANVEQVYEDALYSSLGIS